MNFRINWINSEFLKMKVSVLNQMIKLIRIFTIPKKFIKKYVWWLNMNNTTVSSKFASETISTNSSKNSSNRFWLILFSSFRFFSILKDSFLFQILQIDSKRFRIHSNRLGSFRINFYHWKFYDSENYSRIDSRIDSRSEKNWFEEILKAKILWIF